MIPVNIVEIIDKGLTLGIHKIFTSLEGNNPTGSIKDRMVIAEIEKLYESNLLKNYNGISEVSSGSTALSLAYYCQQHNIDCHLFLPDDISEEKLHVLSIYNAKLHLSPMETIYQDHETFHLKNKTYFFNQLWDEKKKQYYFQLGFHFSKILNPLDFLIGSIGTSHSLFGVSGPLNTTKIISAEPAKGFKISGVRNIEFERYGDKDPCSTEMLEQRVIINNTSEMFPLKQVNTNAGVMEIGDSFRLVLGALMKFLPFQEKPVRILALGAQNKIN